MLERKISAEFNHYITLQLKKTGLMKGVKIANTYLGLESELRKLYNIPQP